MSIIARNISKRFGDFTALDDVSLEVEGGSLTALLGPSGSGKSTLLRIIAGLETPDGGEIEISGMDATALKPQKRNVGFVFQHYAAFKHMTVRDNVAFGLTVRKRPRAEIRERVDELLRLVQLEAFADRYPGAAVGGQRQRMALARALAPDPQVLLLDEPFGALDARVRAELRDWLRRLHEEVHVTTIFVTHDQAEAMDVASQIAVMNHARIEQVGSPTELYDNPATEFVMSFVGDANRLGDGGCAHTSSTSSTSRVNGAVEATRRPDHDLRVRRPYRAHAERRRSADHPDDARTARAPRGRAGPDRLGAGRGGANVRVSSCPIAAPDGYNPLRGAAVGPSLEPGSCPVPRRRDHEAGSVRVLPRGRAGARPAPAQSAVHDEALADGVAGEAYFQKQAPKGMPPGSRRAPTAPIRARAGRGSSTSRSSTRRRRCSGWCR